MKDRQFMVVLGLAVSAGLVLGLIAFRMTGASPVAATAPTANAAAANPNAPRPSAADEASVQPSDTAPPSTETQSQNGEPTVPAKEPPEMQGPTNGDPPGTAVGSDGSSASSDVPPQ